MRILILITLALFSLNLLAGPNSKLANGQLAYYGEDFYNGKISRDALFKILNESHTTTSGSYDVISSSCQSQGTCYRHQAVGYDTARKIMFGELFIKKDREGNFVQDVYCGKKFYFKQVSDISQMGREVNIEHTWPQSKFNPEFEKNLQKSDLHHLYPTDSDANGRRANYAFGNVSEQEDELHLSDCTLSRLSQRGNRPLFTPPTTHRGNVARSLFYFSIRYQLPISSDEERVLKQWHKTDPVDVEEIERHEIIAKYQKVRNPFVDFPQLVEKVADF